MAAAIHPPDEKTDEDLAEVFIRAADQQGKVIVPSFAVGRTQELVFRISRLQAAKKIPLLPIYVDSPLTVDVTEIYRLHPDCYDEDVRRVIDAGGEPFGFKNLTYIRDVEASKALNGKPGPMMIISASGMAETGRILHHLRNNIDDPRNTILIVGYQAHGTLGRKLVEKQPEVNIFGDPYPVRARVKVMNSLSAHADQPELLSWILHESDPEKQVFVVHGDADQSEALVRELKARGAPHAAIPDLGAEYPLVTSGSADSASRDLASSHSRSIAARSVSAGRRPWAASCVSMYWKRRMNFAVALRSAASGSMRSRRATLTTAKSTSPSSSRERDGSSVGLRRRVAASVPGSTWRSS